jgi:transcriptional regulator with XRE-family HTH domain
MPARQRPGDLGAEDARRLGSAVASELRDARLAAGLSQAVVARGAGMSASQWGRVERGELASATTEQICRAACALGMVASVKLYPQGAPVRDAGHLALVERFEARLRPPLRLRREVAVPIAGDLRAWDGMVEGDARPFFSEFETHLHDVQAIERRIGLKLRDDPRGFIVVLVVTRSHHNRRVLARHREALRSRFPLDGGAVLRAIGEGRSPAASGIVML